MMDKELEQSRLTAILTSTISSLCKNGVGHGFVARVEGLLGITLSDNQVFLVKVSEEFCEVETSQKKGMVADCSTSKRNSSNSAPTDDDPVTEKKNSPPFKRRKLGKTDTTSEYYNKQNQDRNVSNREQNSYTGDSSSVKVVGKVRQNMVNNEINEICLKYENDGTFDVSVLDQAEREETFEDEDENNATEEELNWVKHEQNDGTVSETAILTECDALMTLECQDVTSEEESFEKTPADNSSQRIVRGRPRKKPKQSREQSGSTQKKRNLTRMGTSYRKYKKSNSQNAVKAVYNGVMNATAASHHYGVPKSTIIYGLYNLGYQKTPKQSDEQPQKKPKQFDERPQKKPKKSHEQPRCGSTQKRKKTKSKGGSKTYKKYTMTSLESALNAVSNGVLKVHEASAQYGVPKTSLRDRLKRLSLVA